MDRTEFLKLCQECAALPDGMCGVKKSITDAHKVYYNGIAYYPIQYQLGFTNDGKTRHTAILHDIQTNSIISCTLDKVYKKG